MVYNNTIHNITEKKHLWGFKYKARKCPIGTVSVCLKKSGVGKLIVYDSDVENGEAIQFRGLSVIVNILLYHFV